MNISRIILTSSALTLFGAPLAQSAEINWSGFATIEAGQTLKNDTEYEGHTNKLDTTQGTLFAIQGSSNLSNGMSATVQMVAQAADEWNLKLSWAYLVPDRKPCFFWKLINY